ncbi:MAG: hypothetical protein JSW20_05870 [Nitrospiraceae bacterium]|nr:MAG: hypothetical protein JSW20_05870 [Nitrospiraceae bacterium]
MILIAGVYVIAIACGGGGGNGQDNSNGNASSGSGDFVRLSIDGGAETTFTEAFSQTVVCEPRVDWALNQVILYDNYVHDLFTPLTAPFFLLELKQN